MARSAWTRHEQYFELYFELGPGRTLEKLAGVLVDDPETDCDSLAGTRRSLEDMSAKYHWQEQVRQRVKKRGEEIDDEIKEEVLELVREFIVASRVDMGRYIRQIQATRKSKKPVMIENAADLDRIMRLAMSSAGTPVAERVEHTGRDGRPLELDHTMRDWDDLTDEEIARRLTESDNGDDAEPDDEPDADDAEAGGDSAPATEGSA